MLLSSLAQFMKLKTTDSNVAVSQLPGISYLPSRTVYPALYRVELYLISFIWLNLSKTEGSEVFEQCEAQTPALLWRARPTEPRDVRLSLLST